MDFGTSPPLLTRGAAGHCSASAAGAVVHRHQQLRSGASSTPDANETQAHEMVPGAPADQPELASSQRGGPRGWLEEYPDQLGIALTDCITMDAFLRRFRAGISQPAIRVCATTPGDPVEWGEKAIAHYQEAGHRSAGAKCWYFPIISIWRKRSICIATSPRGSI